MASDKQYRSSISAAVILPPLIGNLSAYMLYFITTSPFSFSFFRFCSASASVFFRSASASAANCFFCSSSSAFFCASASASVCWFCSSSAFNALAAAAPEPEGDEGNFTAALAGAPLLAAAFAGAGSAFVGDLAGGATGCAFAELALKAMAFDGTAF
eukprot:CAMPEP_0172907778 /NCGR_PEP_ID=MMETSP1075-20121228/179508_1 /TAXON_ID=2916 /ORGANISM="Ceratium fusus, Strain PA161109" /LENGTH=156 /DNA_ID=CAMNT_0013765449 /DNA_START=72 /DNA_END=539 /DNA_ORIENTATION=-